MMFHGVEATQKTLMMTVARKMLMYFGYKPLTSLLKGYVPVHIESEMQFQISTGGIRNRTYLLRLGCQLLRA